jgi:prepilin-type N-terminal cleavage/methylation domain-containing protein
MSLFIARDRIRHSPDSCQARPAPGHHRAGFTLIELLVTLVILSTGIVLVLQAFETSAVALGESRDAMRASFLIAQKIEDLRENTNDRGDGTGVFQAPYGKYQWKASARDVEQDGYSIDLVTVSVWHPDSKAIYAASTYMRKE